MMSWIAVEKMRELHHQLVVVTAIMVLLKRALQEERLHPQRPTNRPAHHLTMRPHPLNNNARTNQLQDENVSHEVTTEDIPAVETTTGATPECTG